METLAISLFFKSDFTTLSTIQHFIKSVLRLGTKLEELTDYTFLKESRTKSMSTTFFVKVMH